MTVTLSLNNVFKVYQVGATRVTALAGVSLDIFQGEMLAIMGPSGSGKSTFVQIAGLLDRPTSGTVELNGRRVDRLSEVELAKLRNRKLGFVFQQFNLLPRIPAWENVALPLVYADIPARVRRQRTKEIMAQLGMLDRLNHTRAQLSGGEQQRTAIARALINDPSVVFADEPTGNLDTKSGKQIMEILRAINTKGRTIVLVTHEAQVAAYAQRIITLSDGTITSVRQVPGKRRKR